jgi:Sec7-like guanine-nucleotide exchange factor
MNESPKKIFKRVDGTSNADVKESLVQKYAKVIKKTSHLENKSMIGLLGSDHAVSAQLFGAYAELMLRQCREHNLEEFIRMFTSNFFLTGESQQIARVLDTITKFYYSHQE